MERVDETGKQVGAHEAFGPIRDARSRGRGGVIVVGSLELHD